MAHEVWLYLDEVIAATKWSRRTIFYKEAKGELKTKKDDSGKNGKPRKQYAASSLPADTQIKLFQQRIESEALVKASNTPHPIFPKLALPTERDRLALNVEDNAQAELRFKIISPMIEFKNATNGHRPVYRNTAGVEITTLRGVASHIAKIQQLSPRTVWEWYMRYANGFSHLADRHRSDNGKSRFFQKHPDAGEFALNKYWNERLSYQLVHEAIVRNWDRLRGHEDAKPPSYNTLLAFLKAKPKMLEDLARKGDKTFHEEYIGYIIRDTTPLNVNQIWIADHMLHDLFVWNDGVFGEKEIGKLFRPWLTAIIDMKSRYCVGAVWCATPSSRSISAALRMAVCNFGRPHFFYIDNGKDFKKIGKEPPTLSPEAGGVLIRLGIKSQYCKKYHGQSKSIERFFGTIHTRFDLLHRPAYCGRNPSKMPEDCRAAQSLHAKLLDAGDLENSPFRPASEIFRQGEQWINEFNSSFHHSGQGMNRRTPAEVFHAEIPREKLERIDPVSVADLFWDRRKCTVIEGGKVRLNRSVYEPANPQTFAVMQPLIKREIFVACDPLSMGEAIAVSQDGTPLGHLRAQALLVHGATSQADIQNEMKLRSRMLTASRQLLSGLENKRRMAGDLTEAEELGRRAAASAAKPVIETLPLRKVANTKSLISPRNHVDDVVAILHEEEE
jgi:transposase InsO family protein